MTDKFTVFIPKMYKYVVFDFYYKNKYNGGK